jgi:hypothetical protein
VGVEVIDDGIDWLKGGINPGVDLAEKVDPVGRRPTVVRLREG